MNTTTHQQIAFVLDNVADNQTLVAGIPSETPVYVLESSGDVLAQIATITSGYSNLDAIHLYSHGSDGALDLGSITLDSSNLNNHATILAQIGSSLSQSGDILLYGCNVAQGQSGVEFISKLSQATGADIAASDDLTGSSDKGGDWVLEAHTGSVEAQAISANEFEWVLAPSGSPVYDFEGPATQVDTNEVTFAANDHTLDTSSSNGTVTNMGHYLSANTSATGTIHLHFTDGATFDASSIKLEKFNDEDSANLMITSNLTNRDNLNWMNDASSNQEKYVWNTALSGSSFATIDLSMFTGATNLYIEGWSGGAISGLYIDDFTVDFPVTNAAPVITNLNGDSVSVAPGEVGMIDADQMPNNAWVTDSDSANFNNGYLLIHQATGTTDGNFSAIDSVVLFNASGTGLDGNDTPVSASGTPAHGNDVYVMTMAGWVKIGVVDQLDGQNGADLRIDLNAGATPNCISTILETLQYSSNTAGTRTFETTVSDNGTDLSNVATFTVVVGTPNTAPVITDLDGDTFALSSSGIYLDVTQNATIFDSELDDEAGNNDYTSDWTGATLTVERVGGAVASDVITIAPATVAVNEITHKLSYGGHVVGTYTSINGTLTVNFTGENGGIPDNDVVQQIINGVYYENAKPYGSADLRFTLSDGQGGSTTADVTVTSEQVYIDNATDTTTIDRTNGVSFSEAISIAAADNIISNKLYLDSSMGGQTVSMSGATTLGESFTLYNYANSTTVSGGTLSISSGKYLSFSDNHFDKTLNFNGVLTGAGGIINKAYGTVQLGGTNTYSGGTTLFSGTLEIAGQANIGSGDINFVSTSNQTPATLCLTNTSNTTITSAITINNLNGGVIQVAGDSGVATIISGVISGTASGNLTLQSEGGADNSVMPIIQLSGTNTFDGKTIVDMAHTNSQNMGYVMIAGDSNLGTGALELTSGGLIITNDTTIDNVVILKNSNHDLVIGSGKSVEFSGNMSGDTSFSIYSDGTDSQVIFSGTNTNAGGVSVSENATLTLSSTTNSAIADTANLGILLGTVILNQDSETIGNLYSNGGSLEIGSNTLTVSGSGDSIFDVSLVGSGNLVIQSNSNHTFTVNSNAASMSNFTGITTVNSNGKLLLGSGGNLSGAIIVDDTGLLTGDGTALGLVTVKSGGTLGAGNISGYATSVADIDLKGGLTAEAGSTLHFNIKGNTAGSTYDQLKVVGAVDIAGATLTVVDTTYAVTAGTEIVLISNDLSDSVTGTFSGLDEGATVTVNGVDMTIHYNGGDGNDVTLTAPVATANTVPVNTISESYTTSEDTVKSITDLTIADADNNTLSVTLSVNHGTINIANINTAADITVIDDNGLDGSISFSGSVDSINAMLADGVDYYAVANANGDNAATLTMTTSDGIADAVVDSAAVNISIINDAPTFNHSFGTFADDFSGGYYYDNADSYAEAYASALQPYGKLVSVGYAEMDGGDPYLAITRTHLDGTLDASFGHDGELAIQGYYGAESVAIQPDGNILIAGIDVNENAFIARFDEYGNGNFGNDGFIDVTDDTGLNSLGVTQVTLQPDGKILVAGTQNPDGGDGGDVALVRYNADGTLDTGFGSNGVVIQDMGSNNADDASAVAIDTNGKIVIAGSVAGDFAVSRFNADGTLDTSFNTTGIKTVDFGTETGADGLAIQSDSKIVAVGTSNNTADGDYDIALARFNTDGSLDTNFGTGGKVILSQIHTLLGEFDVPVTNGDDIGYGVTLDKEGNIYVSGQFSYIGENFAGDSITASFMAVAKYNSSGILDANFGNGGIYMPDYVASGNLYDSDSAYGQNILVQPDGKVVVTGGDSYPSYWNADINYSDFVVTRLDSTTGIPDSQFGYPVNTVEQANTTAFEEDGDAVTIGGSDYSDFLPTIYDVEQNALDNYSGGTLTVHRDGGANSEDLIRFDTSNSSAMTTAGITLEGTSATTGNIKHANQTFATFDTGTAGQLVIHFTSSDATQALVDAVTASISYKDTNNINPGYDAGEVNLAWTYNDGNDEEVASTTYIKIEGANDGDISGTVTVSGTPLTGSTLSAAGLDTIKDPDLVTADNPNGYVSENDMSFQWQVYDTQTSEWVNIDGAYNATFEVTAAENGLQIRVTVGYEDVTNGAYSELESSATGTPSGGGNSGGGNSGGGSSTPTPVVPEPVAPTPVLPEPVVPEPVAPTPTPTSPTIVDGVQVNTGTVTETRTTTDTNGNTVTTSVTTEQLIIPTVSETRTDSTGTTTTADIPLFWGESSRTEWATTANIPVGIGLVSEGSRAPTVNQTIASALGDLLYYIDTTTPAADMSKSNQLGGGSSFLDLLSNVSTLIVNKITLTNDSGIASHTPVTINGTANSITTSTGTSAPVEAIVIDASTLPQESYLNLQNIEFAVLVGDGITVRGGAGANIFFSGAGSQNIVLGKEDDILHAGAGDDIVGSVSGNDTVYGDEGNDTVFGGSGWDTLSGGEGSDAINGGLGYDTALQEGSKSDYSIQIANGTIVMTDKTSHSIDTLKDINEIHFNNGEILYVANNIAQQKILLALGHDKSEILYVPLIQTVAGTSANDTYQLADNLYGLSVDAKGGNDTLNVTGNFKDFRVEQTQTGVEITSLINGTMNELKNFESILFSDGSNIVIIDNLISLVGSHYPTDAIIG